jgi:hypothetical protein
MSAGPPATATATATWLPIHPSYVLVDQARSPMHVKQAGLFAAVIGRTPESLVARAPRVTAGRVGWLRCDLLRCGRGEWHRGPLCVPAMELRGG